MIPPKIQNGHLTAGVNGLPTKCGRGKQDDEQHASRGSGAADGHPLRCPVADRTIVDGITRNGCATLRLGRRPTRRRRSRPGLHPCSDLSLRIGFAITRAPSSLLSTGGMVLLVTL